MRGMASEGQENAMASVETLLQVNVATRALRAYAYLTTTLRLQPETADVLDCLVPFIRAGIDRQVHGAPLNIVDLSQFLETLGLHVPDLVLLELRPKLCRLGILEQVGGEFFIRHGERADPKQVSAEELIIDQAFDEIECKLAEYSSNNFSRSQPLYSETWSDALITFLKSETSAPTERITTNRRLPTIGGRMVGDPQTTEIMIVSKFIQHCDTDPSQSHILDRIVQIFTGILIEDFIRTVQSLGDRRRYKGLAICYDTAVLLRLLGTSGKLLQLATMEMHNNIQSLGCSTHYLDITKREVQRILDGMVENILSAHPETIDAYDNLEFTLEEIADYPDTFESRLNEHLGITLLRYSSASAQESWRINETVLTEMLIAESDNWRRQSAQKDAQAVGVIIQIRKGVVSTEVAEAKCIFISRNPLLMRVTKKFVYGSVAGYEDEDGVPPVLTVGQMATLAWLSTPRKLDPTKVTRELLTNCYNAVRPGPEWMREFYKIFNKYIEETPGSMEKIASSAMFRRTTRNLMQNASLNQSVLLKPTNIELIIRKAEKETAARAAIAERRRLETEATLREEIRLAELRAQQAESELHTLKEQEQMGKEQEARRAAEAEAQEARRAAEAEARRKEEVQTAAEAALRSPSSLHSNPLSKMIVLSILLGCAIVGFYLLRESIVVCLILLAFFVAALPPFWAIMFESHKLTGPHLLETYKLGLSSLPAIGNLMALAPRDSADLHPRNSVPGKPSRKVGNSDRKVQGRRKSREE